MMGDRSASRKRARLEPSVPLVVFPRGENGPANALDLAQDCQRRLRCGLAALRIESSAELMDLLDSSRHALGEHILAPVTAGCNCHFCGRSVDARQGCRHRRSHMQSTKNSKRSVHTFLKWVTLLGPNFPITDSMLQESFWKNLDPICDFGVRKENGHARRPGQPVCINPHHYTVIHHGRVLSMLLHEIEPFFTAVPRFRAVAAMAHARAGEDPSTLFSVVVGQLRAAVEDFSWSVTPLAYLPPVPRDENDYEAFLHFVAHACSEDLCRLEVGAVMAMTAITPRGLGVPC